MAFGNNGGVDQFGYGGPGDEDLVRENRLRQLTNTCRAC